MGLRGKLVSLHQAVIHTFIFVGDMHSLQGKEGFDVAVGADHRGFYFSWMLRRIVVV